MIVCVCNNVSDKKIIEEIQNGAKFEDLQFNLGVCCNCGLCEDYIHHLIFKHSNKEEIKT